MLNKPRREQRIREIRRCLLMYVKRAGDPYWLMRAKTELDLLVQLETGTGEEKDDEDLQQHTDQS